MKLSQYDKKRVRVTDQDGRVFEGVGDWSPSGYGLHEFDREEESLNVRGYQLFEGDIARVEWVVKDIDDYIRQQKKEIRPVLRAVRKTIRAALPDAQECLSWQMPTWRRKHNLIHFAAQKKHVGIYPGPEAIARFAEKLREKGYAFSKGAIQLPYDRVDLALVREIADYCGQSQDE